LSKINVLDESSNAHLNEIRFIKKVNVKDSQKDYDYDIQNNLVIIVSKSGHIIIYKIALVDYKDEFDINGIEVHSVVNNNTKLSPIKVFRSKVKVVDQIQFLSNHLFVGVCLHNISNLQDDVFFESFNLNTLEHSNHFKPLCKLLFKIINIK
jgi:hypothetical protein